MKFFYKILSFGTFLLIFSACHTTKGDFASRMLFGEYWSIIGMVIIIIVTAVLYGLAHICATSPTFRVKAGEYEREIIDVRDGRREYKDEWGFTVHTQDFTEYVRTGEYETYRITKAEEKASIELERFTRIKHDLDVQCGYSCACLLSIAFTLFTNGLSGTDIKGELAIPGLLMGLAVIVIYLYCIIKQSLTNPIELALSSQIAKYLRIAYLAGFGLFFVAVCIGDTGLAAIGDGIVFFIKTIFGIGYGVATLLNLAFDLSDAAFTAITILVTIPSMVGLYKVLYQWISKLYKKSEESDKTSIIIVACTFLFLIAFFCYLPCSILLN